MKGLKEYRPIFEDILYVIDQLNNRISEKYDKLSANQQFQIMFITDGYYQSIEFNGICLWSTEDDCGRKYDEDHDVCESFDKFLKRRFNEEMSIFSKLKV